MMKSQSLVPNGSFENHKPFCGDCVPYSVNCTIEYLNYWKFPGPHHLFWFCHTSLPIIERPEWQYSFCRQVPCTPHSGQGMISLFYIESCPFHETTPTGKVTGCPSYVYAKLSSPLVVGNIYEISMWVYFPEDPVSDKTILKNIGFYLTLSPEKVGWDAAISTDYFFSDSIVCNQWFEIKHYIRALCPLKYITIGAFYDDNFPVLHRSIENYEHYFVDDVNVIEVNEDSLSSDIEATPFCNYYEKRVKEAEARQPQETNIYFETASFTLDIEDVESLDSFYTHTTGSKGNLYIVSGHADNQGIENITLSDQRAHAVAEYLQEKYNLSPYKFVSFGLGANEPVGDNRTEAGRQLNRRVTIANSDIRTSAAVYRKALGYIENGDKPLAIKTFEIWHSTVPVNQRMTVLHDPRLNKMKDHPSWRQLVQLVKEHYKSGARPEDSFFLDSMYYVDQRYRSYNPIVNTGYIQGLDTFDMRSLNPGFDHMEKADSINLHALTAYLADHPFPIISEVGRRQVRAAGYILIHSLDSTVMKQYIPVIEANCLLGEAEWDIYALMTDKLQLVRGKPQLYGTQKVFVDDTRSRTRLYEVDNLEAVNERRKRIGMVPIRE